MKTRIIQHVTVFNFTLAGENDNGNIFMHNSDFKCCVPTTQRFLFIYNERRVTEDSRGNISFLFTSIQFAIQQTIARQLKQNCLKDRIA